MTRKRFDFSEAMDRALGSSSPRTGRVLTANNTTHLSTPDAYALGYNDGSAGLNSREGWVRQQAPEQCEIVRRIAERGRAHASEQATKCPCDKPWSSQVDLWQHLLDELERL